jgi:hypothetical protein
MDVLWEYSSPIHILPDIVVFSGPRMRQETYLAEAHQGQNKYVALRVESTVILASSTSILHILFQLATNLPCSRLKLKLPNIGALRSKQKPPRDMVLEWKTWKLRKRNTIPLAILDIAIIATVLALDRISATRNGIANVPSTFPDPNTRVSTTNIIWSYGLLWTALPSFLMTLYRMSWDALVSAAAERQPFVELAQPRNKASSVRRTIMLDYRSYPSFYNWAIAFRRGHRLLCASMLLSTILSIALVPLAARLLTDEQTEFLSDLNVSVPATFDDEAINGQTDFQAFMTNAAAISIYKANPPAWSTTQYSFQPFEVNDKSISGNVTANITAYSALLDCQVKTASEFEVAYSNRIVQIKGSDRGCEFPKLSMQYAIVENVQLYTVAWSVQCSAAAHYSRFGVVTANFLDTSQTKFTNLTVLSCIPTYWKTQGRLTVSLIPAKLPTFANFLPEETSVTEIHPLFHTVLENSLPSYTTFNPSTYVADAWGHLVYTLAAQRNPQNPLNSTVIRAAMETLFSSFYVSLATTQLFVRDDNPQQLDAKLMEQTTRLFIVSPVAWTIAIIMFCVFVCNVLIIIHSERSTSILQEEPKGLLGSAALLQDSDVSEFVAQLRGSPPQVLNVRKTIKRSYNPDTAQCWYDHDRKRICLLGMQHNETTALEEH